MKSALTGRTVLMPTDDAAKYGAFVASYFKEFQPIGMEETALLQSIVDIRWRLERIPALESSLFCVGLQKFAEDFPKLDLSNSATVETQIRLMFEKEFRNLAIQESRLARRREKEMAEFKALQTERKAKESEELDRASQACLLAEHRNQQFDSAENGFAFSKERLDTHLAKVAAVRRQLLLQNALKSASATQKAAA